MTDGRPSHGTRIGPPRVLIIEDEPLIFELMEGMVCELGYVVSGKASTVSAAREELAKCNFDTVLLDIGLDGTNSPVIADLLLEMGIHFGFATGYNDPFETRHAGVPLLRKPFTPVQLRAFLETLVGPPSSSREMSRTARAPASIASGFQWSILAHHPRLSTVLHAFSSWKTSF